MAVTHTKTSIVTETRNTLSGVFIGSSTSITQTITEDGLGTTTTVSTTTAGSNTVITTTNTVTALTVAELAGTLNSETTSIEWTDLVSPILEGEDPSGYANDLMETARYHISKAFDANEMTQAEVGQAYVAMIPAAFSTGLEYLLRKDLTEAQTNEQLTDTDRKTAWSNKDLEIKDKDISVKLLGTQLQAWTSVFNSGKYDEKPVIISPENIADTYRELNDLVEGE